MCACVRACMHACMHVYVCVCASMQRLLGVCAMSCGVEQVSGLSPSVYQPILLHYIQPLVSFDVTHCVKASLASLMLLRLVVGYFDHWEWHVCSSVVTCVSTRFEGGLTTEVGSG